MVQKVLHGLKCSRESHANPLHWPVFSDAGNPSSLIRIAFFVAMVFNRARHPARWR
jgi:hypothetical protein